MTDKLSELQRILYKKNRNRIDIVADVLIAAKKGAKSTRIMYDASLSYTLLKKYLGITMEAKLLREERKNDASIFYTTPRGEYFLGKYNEYSERMGVLKKEAGELYSQASELNKMLTIC